MKKLISMLLTFVLLLQLSACSGTPRSSDSSQIDKPVIIKFTDIHLEEGIRAAMNKSTGDITASDAKMVTVLDLSNKDWDAMNAKNGGIKDISGLKYFTNLTELHLDYNDIQDLSPLSTLTQLSILSFSAVRVEDLSPLESLTNMVTLVFNWSYAPDQGHYGYENIDFIAGMKKLEVFEACNAGLKDITVLGKLPKLKSVHIFDNQITDISPLAKLDLKEFSLANNPITDYSSITPIREVFPNLWPDFVPDVGIK